MSLVIVPLTSPESKHQIHQHKGVNRDLTDTRQRMSSAALKNFRFAEAIAGV
jgi:hypothetical protein